MPTTTEQIAQDVKTALKARDRERAQALRLVLSALQADQKEGAADEQAVLRRERKRRRESEAQYRDAGRPELAEQEAYEAGLIESYLPQPLSDEELAQLVRTAIADTGAEGPRDMGKVIKHVMAAAGGRAEGGAVSKLAKQELAA